MNRNFIETVTGLVVIAIAIYFVMFALQQSNQSAPSDSLNLNISFDRIDGITKGSDVRISGLKIGSVTSTSLNNNTYQANVSIALEKGVKIPEDSTAEIISAGLLGDKYIAIIPGGTDEYLQDGDKIKYTQSSISLESLIGKFMFSGGDDSEEDNAKDDFF
jgi:phospholipid/cholesterol/gamma-HCH transport system substrate-binding protein